MSRSPAVLLPEDSDDDALLIEMHLRRGGLAPRIERVLSPEGMSAALERGGIDVVIADYHMPGFGASAGLDWCGPAKPTSRSASMRSAIETS